jgi:hypothetical protein
MSLTQHFAKRKFFARFFINQFLQLRPFKQLINTFKYYI